METQELHRGRLIDHIQLVVQNLPTAQSAQRRGRAMHRSRLGNIVIDCKTDDLLSAAQFWSAALGYPLPQDLDAASRFIQLVPRQDDRRQGGGCSSAKHSRSDQDD